MAPDDISSIYLPFDYDEQHRKFLPQNAEPTEIVKSMLSSFNNETDNGLMYISYPMSEAVRDYQDNFCTSLNGCLCSIDNFEDYKLLSVQSSLHTDISRYSYDDWKMIINIFIQRCCCLFNKEDISSDRNSYLNIVHPEAILEKQRVIRNLHHSVFILSAFSELL